MKVIREVRNPVRYSLWLMLFLTLCLLFAEHNSPVQTHNMDVDYMVNRQSGTLMRQLAYISIGALGFIGTYYTLILQRVRLRWNRTVTIVLGLLLSWSFLSLLWATAPAIAARRLFVLALMFLGAMGLALSWKRAEILKFMAWSSAIQITLGFVAELLYGYFTPWQSDYRFSGTLPGNREGYVCLVLTLSTLCLAHLNQRGRWFYLVLSGYGLVSLLLTRSRGGLLAFGSALVLYFLITLKIRERFLITLGIGTLALIVIISGVAPTLMSTLNRGGEGSDDFDGRGPLWEELLTYVDRRPLIGYGYENFWTIARIDDISSDQRWAITGAHSGYIESLLEIGWIGATLHMLTLLVCMGAGIRLFKRTGDYAYFLGAALCLIYLVGGLLEGILIIKASEISFYFAVSLCVMTVQTEQGPEDGAISSAENWSHAGRAARLA